MKQPEPGSKLAQLRALGAANVARTSSPVGRHVSQTRREAGHGTPAHTEPDTSDTVATKAQQARRVMEGAAAAFAPPRALGIEQATRKAAADYADRVQAEIDRLSTSTGSVEDHTKAPATAEGSTQATTADQETATMKTSTKRKPATKSSKAKGKATRERRKVASTAARPTKAAGDKKTMVDQIIKLAQREKGATVAELNELSGWKGCPWKWQFSNKKNTGWCQKRGLTFKVEARDDGTTAYHVGPAKAE